VVGGLVVVDLVDGNSGVNNVGLDDLLLDNGLNGLVDVVVDMLAANRWGYALALCGGLDAPLVPELGLLLSKVPLDVVVVTVIELAVLDCAELGSVCLWKNFTVLHGLNGAVIVILVNLLVYRCDDFLMLVRLDGLVDDCRSNSLMDGGVMVAGTVSEIGEGCLDFVHCGVCGC
jgi:hypothetical protein